MAPFPKSFHGEVVSEDGECLLKSGKRRGKMKRIILAVILLVLQVQIVKAEDVMEIAVIKNHYIVKIFTKKYKQEWKDSFFMKFHRYRWVTSGNMFSKVDIVDKGDYFESDFGEATWWVDGISFELHRNGNVMAINPNIKGLKIVLGNGMTRSEDSVRSFGSGVMTIFYSDK